jgi:hypothetical protein
MLVQFINLYRDSVDADPELSFTRILQIWGVFFVLLLIYYGVYSFFSTKKLGEEILLKTQSAALIKTVASKKTLISSDATRSTLQKNIDDLIGKKIEKTGTIELLKQQGLDKSIGFSFYLTALSEKHVSETWYTKINIDNNGNSIALSGKSLNSQWVPNIFSALRGTEAFQGKFFQNVLIAQDTPGQPTVTFVAQTDGAIVLDRKKKSSSTNKTKTGGKT